MRIETQLVAIERAEAPVALISIIVLADLAAFAPEVAIANGFIVRIEPDGTELWEGGITDEGVDEELTRAGIADAVRWVRVDSSDIPADRSQRALWRLEGDRIVVGAE